MATLAPEQRLPRPRNRSFQHFFVSMAAFAAVILMLAFVPEAVRFAAGTFPIPVILHVHAAFMVLWVVAFALQAYLGATGQTAKHSRLGPFAVASGWMAWASMVVVEFRTFTAHPLPQNPAEYDWNLPGPFVYLTFGVFLAWAVRERHRPQWHKRLMTFALFLSLEAAIQRFVWIPMDYGFGPFAAVLDMSLLAPLIAYDLRTLKGRLHPATLYGSLLLFSSEAVLFGLWGTPAWRHLAYGMAHLVRG